jgi:galactose mutarotase-like enzyme
MPPRPDESREHRLRVGDVEIVLDLDAGGRAVSWQVGDLSLLAHHGDEPVEYGMYPMAPWAGRLRDNAVVVRDHVHEFPITFGAWAIHGVALDAPVDILDSTQTDDLSRVVLRVADSGTWPWPMAIDIIWELRPRELTTAIVVHALEEEFPAVVGWHPWFVRSLGRGRPLAWLTDAESLVERGDDHQPTGRLLPTPSWCRRASHASGGQALSRSRSPTMLPGTSSSTSCPMPLASSRRAARPTASTTASSCPYRWRYRGARMPWSRRGSCGMTLDPMTSRIGDREPDDGARDDDQE